MECYEGAKMIKTFRGLLADGAQDKINLKTLKGEIGYRITKFQIITETPGTDTVEGVCKIYKVNQSTIDGTVNFTDGDLLAVAEYHKEQNEAYPLSTNIIFDQEIFNQNIYLTWAENGGGTGPSMNYYLELEQVMLNENESAMATLQSLRTVASR